MSAWPEERFDIFRDSANYSCVSSNNSVGSGVRSSTYFAVEYPPENATVSIPKVSVVEGTVPQQVLCSAKAFPGMFCPTHKIQSISFTTFNNG